MGKLAQHAKTTGDAASQTSQWHASDDTCNATLVQQQSQRNPCLAGDSFGCFSGTPCTMWVQRGCRGVFSLRCERREHRPLTCGFPGQRKSERLNCSHGAGLREQAEPTNVGMLPRPAIGVSERALPRKRVRSLAVCLHGKIGTWRRSATELHNDRHASSRTRGVAEVISLAAVAAVSIAERVVEPNKRAGLDVAIYLHSWSPEVKDALEARLTPAASLYEDPVHKDKVLSQHLSIKRVLNLMDTNRPPPRAYDLVLVSRLDIYFYSDLALHALPRTTSAWLPEFCQERRHGLGVTQPATRERVRRVCGCLKGRCHVAGMPNIPLIGFAEVPTPQRLFRDPASWRWRPLPGSRYRALEPALSFNAIVNDVWFVATPAVARSFSWIYDSHEHYLRELRQQLNPHGDGFFAHQLV